MKEKIIKAKNYVMNLLSNDSFTMKEQLSFSGGLFGNSMAQDICNTFMTLFLVSYMGIPSEVLIPLMLVSKITNIVLAPIAGAVLDLGIGKSGKSVVRPMLLFTPIPLAISTILLFYVPAISLTARIVYVFIFYFIFIVADGFYDMALLTMSTRMTTNMDDRKTFYSIAEFAGTLGAALPAGLIPIILALFDDSFDVEKNVYLACTITFAVLGCAGMILPYLNLREKTLTTYKKTKQSINVKYIATNKPLVLVTIGQVFDSFRQVTYSALPFFYLHTLDAFWVSAVIGIISGALSYVSIALVPFLGKWFSARDMIVFSYTFTGVCYLLLLLVGYQSIFLIILLVGIGGFPNGMARAARRIILADSVDYMEYKTYKKYGEGVRSEGMVFAVNSMANRINSLWKDLLLPIGLVYIGFKSAEVIDGVTIEAVQTPEALVGLFYLVTIPALVGNFIPAIVMACDNFTGKRRVAILEELKVFRGLADKEETIDNSSDDSSDQGDQQGEQDGSAITATEDMQV